MSHLSFLRLVTSLCVACVACNSTHTEPKSPPPHELTLPEPPIQSLEQRASRLHSERTPATKLADNLASIDHQIAMYEASIRLYEQFIERASTDPRFSDAVRRSRERIVDARETIEFLKAGRDEAPGN